ncbi:hypothetical protein HYALB_00008598 [Hymenoscyphus albidus]|uniref:BTB domain-containing protein n=1 Tax=Hymenoscyphus albidus TaxID=595503 RepID=A0A9N9LGE7_9HELO|nr:hypothetical protein HYALB_00008598 [Hymenoscyphus albidus]
MAESTELSTSHHSKEIALPQTPIHTENPNTPKPTSLFGTPKHTEESDSSTVLNGALKGVNLDGRITIQVGNKRFTTLQQTLTDESEYFRSILSRWKENVIQKDGSYFYDGDPVLFAHILQYLRRGVLPVFHDNSRGHDHTLYSALLVEAKYLQIDHLVKWIEQKKYLEAIKVSFEGREVSPGSSADPSQVLFTGSTIDGDVAYLVPPFFASWWAGNDGNRAAQISMSKDDELATKVIMRKTEIDYDLCCSWVPED